MLYPQGALKWSSIKWSMPVLLKERKRGEKGLTRNKDREADVGSYNSRGCCARNLGLLGGGKLCNSSSLCHKSLGRIG